MKLEEVLDPAEIAGLRNANLVKAFLTDAERRAASAATLYDAGIARGLLLALYKQDLLSDSQFDRLFKAVYSVVPAEVRESVPEGLAANLGKGVVVPASPSTRYSAQ